MELRICKRKTNFLFTDYGGQIMDEIISDKQTGLTDEKKPPIWNRIDHRIMVLISLMLGFLIWVLLSQIKEVGFILVSPFKIYQTLLQEGASGRLYTNISVSLFRVLAGFALAFIVALPVAFLMGWYGLIRSLVEPWIQFFRTIPPIALIPLIIVAMGIGEKAKITVIFICTFLVMVITIYQGVCNVDNTLIKAARVLGANDRNIFFNIIVPASTPYILVALRLGLSTAMTTLVAAELTGATKGLGNMIMEAGQYFRMDLVILGILIIGVIGFTLDKILLFLEKKLTGWQDVGRS
jgi:NitT/TauT family transport system permease protein